MDFVVYLNYYYNVDLLHWKRKYFVSKMLYGIFFLNAFCYTKNYILNEWSIYIYLFTDDLCVIRNENYCNEGE